MIPGYPLDADGDSLRRVADDGSDMSRPMLIEYSISAPDELCAQRIAESARSHGFDIAVSRDESCDSWSIYCARTMLATYDGVVAIQALLNELAQPHGGNCDGWGTFGNGRAR
jgi:regulator of RNase E activity RraB